jgi:uncharacterized paraquat-inducible protein A
MIASVLFDPKLMWDSAEQANKRSRNRLNG